MEEQQSGFVTRTVNKGSATRDRRDFLVRAPQGEEEWRRTGSSNRTCAILNLGLGLGLDTIISMEVASPILVHEEEARLKSRVSTNSFCCMGRRDWLLFSPANQRVRMAPCITPQLRKHPKPVVATARVSKICSRGRGRIRSRIRSRSRSRSRSSRSRSRSRTLRLPLPTSLSAVTSQRRGYRPST
jgi:hypothetical protein